MMFRLLLAVMFVACSLARQYPSKPAYKPLTGPPDPNSPGMRVRLTTKGLNYANGLAGLMLQKEVEEIEIPPFSTEIKKGPGSGKAAATDVKIESFQKPEFYFQLSEPNRVVWGTKGGSATVTGKWNGNYKLLFNIKGSGTFTVKVRDIKLELDSLVKQDSTHRPHINVTSCEAAVEDLDVNITGGLIGWFIARFSGTIEQVIQKSLKAALCETAVTLNVLANQQLANLSTVLPLNRLNEYSLNYELSGDPVVTPDYIDTIHRGEISWHNEGGTPFSPHPIPAPPHDTDRMLYMYCSDFVMNSFLHSAFRHHETRFLISPQSTPTLTQSLRTTCPQTSCIGQAFRGMRVNYPNEVVSVYLHASQMPNVTIENDRANMNVIVDGSMFIEDPVFNNQTHLFDFTTKFPGELNLRVQGLRLVGEFVIKDMKLRDTNSSMGRVSWADKNFFIMALKPILHKYVNDKLQQGFQIPTRNNVQLVSPELRLFDRTLEIATDMRYKIVI